MNKLLFPENMLSNPHVSTDTILRLIEREFNIRFTQAGRDIFEDVLESALDLMADEQDHMLSEMDEQSGCAEEAAEHNIKTLEADIEALKKEHASQIDALKQEHAQELRASAIDNSSVLVHKIIANTITNE